MQQHTNNTLADPQQQLVPLGSLIEESTELWDIHQSMKAGKERKEIANKYNAIAKQVNERRNQTVLRLIH